MTNSNRLQSLGALAFVTLASLVTHYFSCNAPNTEVNAAEEHRTFIDAGRSFAIKLNTIVDFQRYEILKHRSNIISLREGIQRLKEKEGLPAPDLLLQRLRSMGYASGADTLLGTRINPDMKIISYTVQNVTYGKNTVVLHMAEKTTDTELANISYEEYFKGKKFFVTGSLSKNFYDSLKGINETSEILGVKGKETAFHVNGNDIVIYL